MASFHQYDATLSKTLIDSKDRLGSLYYEAKLIECPQNAIELKRLLKKYDQLEKEYSKDVSEVKRGQQMLSLSLTNYLQSDGRNKDASLVMETTELARPLAPGFRFHANGEPKRMSYLDLIGLTGHNDDPVRVTGQHGCHVDQCATRDSVGSTASPRRRVPINLSSWNVGDKASPRTPRKSTGERGSPEQHKHQSNRNYRFAFKPGSINFGKSEGKILRVAKNRRSSLRPACSACQVKLKYSDEAIQKMKRVSKDPLIRWQIAPQGCYVKAPYSYQELDRMVSEVSLRTKSASELLQANHSSELDNEYHGHMSPSKDRSIYQQLQQLCFEDTRAVSSASGVTSLYNRRSSRDSPSQVKNTSENQSALYRRRSSRDSPSKVVNTPENISQSIYRFHLKPYKEKTSLVSFSPSTMAVSPSVAISPSTGRSGSRVGSTNTFRSISSFSRDSSSSRLGQKSSQNFWRTVLEEERRQCEDMVHEFLKKLDGGKKSALSDTGKSFHWTGLHHRHTTILV